MEFDTQNVRLFNMKEVTVLQHFFPWGEIVTREVQPILWSWLTAGFRFYVKLIFTAFKAKLRAEDELTFEQFWGIVINSHETTFREIDLVPYRFVRQGRTPTQVSWARINPISISGLPGQHSMKAETGCPSSPGCLLLDCKVSVDSDPTGALKARFYFPTSSGEFIPASPTDNGALLSLQLRDWLDSMLGSIQDEMIKFNRIMAMQLVRAMFSKSSRREPYMVYDSYDNFFIDPY